MEEPIAMPADSAVLGLSGPVGVAYRQLCEARTPQEVMQRGVDAARAIFGADMSWCAVIDGDSLVGGAFSGWRTTDIAETFRVPLGEGIGGRVVQDGRTNIVRNYLHDPRRIPSLKFRIDEEGVRGGYVAPVPLGEVFGGVIYVAYRTARPLSEDEAALVTIYARDFGLVLHAARERVAVEAARAALEAELAGVNASTDLYRRVAECFADADDLAGGLRLVASSLGAGIILRDAFEHEILSLPPVDDLVPTAARSVQTEVNLHGGLGRLQIIRARPLTAVEVRAATQLAHLVTLQLLRERTAAETEARLRSHFLDDILSGSPADEESLFRQAALLGIDLHSPRAVACVGMHWGAFEPDPGDSRPLRWWVVDALGQAIRARCRNVVSTVRDGAAVLLLESEDDDGTRLQQIMAEILQSVSSRTGMALSAGLGRVCSGVADYAESSREAGTALSLARSRTTPGLVLRGGELGVYGLLAQATHPDALRALVDSSLGPLLSGKGKSSTDFLATLVLYLDNDRNTERTASALHVHVNTLRYRLRRIEELLGVDLHDADSRFLVELAVRVHQVLGP